MAHPLSEQEIGRRESLQKIREMGIDPYPAEQFDVTAFAADIKENYKEEILDDGTKNRLNYHEVALAGRVMAQREAGKAMFMNIQDTTGIIQIYLRGEAAFLAAGLVAAFFATGFLATAFLTAGLAAAFLATGFLVAQRIS